jgi:DNA-binding GntR family transcriptional regulator
LATAAEIGNRIVDAVLSGRLSSGDRLGETQLAALFECSRTIVREALVHLSARGIVTVSSRRGWYVVQLTEEEAREVYDARLAIETGIIRRFGARHGAVPAHHLAQMRRHLDEQRHAIESGNRERRSYLFGDFHVCVARCLGNNVLALRLRDLTVLTSLMLARYQDENDAGRSFAEHVEVIAALEEGDFIEAEERLARHLGTWEEKVHFPAKTDALATLRSALEPDALMRRAS